MENKPNFYGQLHTLLSPVSGDHPEELFSLWQQELTCRRALRNDFSLMTPPETANEFWFYKRTFYDIGQKERFFSILTEYLPQLPWSELLPDIAPAFMREFFAALAVCFSQRSPNAEEVKTLIRLYSPAWDAEYRTLCLLLSEKDLRLLLDKTSNFSLRTLLLDCIEKTEVRDSHLQNILSLSEKQREEMASQALHDLQSELDASPENLSGEEILSSLQKLVTAGKIASGMEIITQLKEKKENAAVFSHLRPFLHLLLPLDALLAHPEAPYLYAQQQHRRFFPHEKTLPSSWLYLHLYQLAARQQSFPLLPFHREFSLRLRQLEALRPDDPILPCLQDDFPEWIAEDSAVFLLKEAQKRLDNAPHETLCLLEILYAVLSAAPSAFSPSFRQEFSSYALAIGNWLHTNLFHPNLHPFFYSGEESTI